MQNVADSLRELIDGHLILIDEDTVVGHEPEDDLILDRRGRQIRRSLGRNANQIAHLHDRRDDHEDDEQNENDVHQWSDIDL